MAQLQRHGIDPQQLSLYVQRVDAPTPLLDLHSAVGRNPASAIKTLTTLVALDQLKPSYTWQTAAYQRGTRRGNRLQGQLILKGEGDPFFVTEQFWKLLYGVQARGIKHLDGELVIDDSYFQLPPGNSGDFDNRPHRPYNVLPNALVVNFQTTQFNLIPRADTQGVTIIADPPASNLTIVNQVALAAGPCRGLASLQMHITDKERGGHVTFSGSYPSSCGDTALHRSVSATYPMIYGVFHSLWGDLGGTFTGGWRSGKVTNDATLVYQVESRPLAELIAGMNKYSNNLMTRQLFLTLGSERYGAPGTLEKGRRAVLSWLQDHGIATEGIVLDNGAGLSRVTRISAKALAEALLAIYRGPHRHSFIASLSQASFDGTLRKRFRYEGLRGYVYGKTGTLRDASAFAGFVQTQAGHTAVAVILLNGRGVSGSRGKDVQNALLRWVYHNG